MILLEAEAFDNLGGWTVDRQFIGQMGSAYLLAHGLGHPVCDAVTSLNCVAGEYVVWVRTKNWAPAAGRFTVVVNGTPVGNGYEFGNGATTWMWERGGTVGLSDGANEICLHDLTGFDGRCDALLFVPATEDYKPDDAAPWAWRKPLLGLPVEPPNGGAFDFVVIGGGYAGLCAAVAAARQGVKTAIVNDGEVFGGNGSTEVRVGPIGRLGLPPFPMNSDLAYELAALTKGPGLTSAGLRPLFDASRLDAWLAKEKNLTVFSSTRCTGATMVEGLTERRIESVVVRNVRTSEESRLSAKFFADCSGDSALAEFAGAEVRTQPEVGESLKGGYGSTNFWTTRWTDKETRFPECPWAMRIDDGKAYGPRSQVVGDYPYAAGWNWESGIDRDAVAEGEEIRDLNFRAAYGMWDYLKNRSLERERYVKAEMDWLGVVLGKRASRRVMGDYVLTENDLVESTAQSDGVVTTTWFLDLHMPYPANKAAFGDKSFRSIAYDDPDFAAIGDATKGGYRAIKPYAIPYRCFYSKDIGNLFMAGKNISATHVAMASVRVENTVAQMGTMVGRAVSLCVRHGWTPRELGENHFRELTQLLKRPGSLSRLAKSGQGRDGLGEMKYWLRVCYHKMKKWAGLPYLIELAG